MPALPRYRFLLAALIFLIRTYGGFVMLVPVLYMADIANEFGISSTAVGNYVGFIMWGCAVVVLFSGPIVSKIGAKTCALTGVIFLLLGMFLTAFTPTNYLVACAIRFLIGLGMVFATIGFMPITMTWFAAEEYGRINGVIEASTSLGIWLNFTFTPTLFPHLWREAHLFYGIPAVILVVLWAILGRNPLIEMKEEGKYLHLLRTRVPKLFRIKEVLFMGGVLFFSMGVGTSIVSWVPSYLSLEWGWPLKTAALLGSMYFLVNLLGWPVGGTLSDRVGLRRPFLIVGGASVFICVFAAVTFVGPASWFWYGLMGLFTAVYGFTGVTIPMEHPQMEPELISTAISIVLLFGFVGGAIMPTVLGWVLDTTGSLYMGMAISSALFTLVTIFGLVSMETGWKGAAEKNRT